MRRLRLIAPLALLALLASPGPLASAPAAPAADLVIVNAHILTMDDGHPEAGAIAIRAGKIVALGTSAEIARLAGPRTRRIDLHGHTLVPGFIDVHMHPRPAIAEMSRYGTLDLTPAAGVTNRARFFAKIRAKARLLPAGVAIVGRGYDDSALGGHPGLAELDQAAGDHPLIITHVSGHRLVANSRALALAGITAATPDPAGGAYGRGPDGALNGQVIERAQAPLRALTAGAPSADAVPAAVRRAGYVAEFRNYLSYGLTGASDAAATPAALATYRDLLRSGMPVSVYAMTLSDHLDWLAAHARDPEWRVPGLSLRTIKIFAGNSLSGHTALLYEPYADSPGEYSPGYRGLEPALQPAALRALVARVQAAGFQAAIHANGDAEIDRVLDAFTAARDADPTAFAAHRDRIEHASITNAAIIARAKALGICFAPHSYILNLGARLDGFGAARFDWIEPNRHALDAGICIGGNSDHPVSPPMVMQRIQSLVTRQALSNGRVYGPSQRLTVREALRVYTLGSAYLQFAEAERGSLAVGKRADLVELSADPERVAPARIGAIQVVRTIIGGRVMFERSGARTIYGW